MAHIEKYAVDPEYYAEDPALYDVKIVIKKDFSEDEVLLEEHVCVLDVNHIVEMGLAKIMTNGMESDEDWHLEVNGVECEGSFNDEELFEIAERV